MRLTDVMSRAGLAGYAVVALVLFFLVFLAVLIWVFRPSNKKAMDRAAHLPLEDEPGDAPAGDASRQNRGERGSPS
jgi:cbb3-type cytochrome oxidase subunit 3